MNRRDLRVATQILNGHAALNYHLSKLNSTIQLACPLSEAEYETVSHFPEKLLTVLTLANLVGMRIRPRNLNL